MAQPWNIIIKYPCQNLKNSVQNLTRKILFLFAKKITNKTELNHIIRFVENFILQT